MSRIKELMVPDPVEYPDCDPSCWEIDAEWVDWDALDEMMFGEIE